MSKKEVNVQKSLFDATKSSTRAETVMDFLNAYTPATELQDVPGIGPAAAGALQKAGCHTIQCLLGIYLTGVGHNTAPTDVCNKFFGYVKSLCPKANAHTVTFAISHLADHLNLYKYE